MDQLCEKGKDCSLYHVFNHDNLERVLFHNRYMVTTRMAEFIVLHTLYIYNLVFCGTVLSCNAMQK